MISWPHFWLQTAQTRNSVFNSCDPSMSVLMAWSTERSLTNKCNLFSRKPSKEVNVVQARKRFQEQQGKRNKNQPQPNIGKGQPTKKNCPGCDSGKHEQKDCHHRDKICSFCKIQGHIMIACQKKKQKEKDNKANIVEEECQNAQIDNVLAPLHLHLLSTSDYQHPPAPPAIIK